MSYNIVVLAKQVPDTKKISGKVMRDDGTINRSALPAIFNPDDLHALELALEIKDKYGAAVTVITMGPPPASEILRQSLYRGADDVALVTDRGCAASDTLATSYILSCAVEMIPEYDIILCGRQAIDGDTAQVGPQTAQKLNIPQVTYVQSVDKLENGKAIVRRLTENAEEVLEVPLPVLFTVLDSANDVRPQAIKKVMAYKRARTASELEMESIKEDPARSKEELQKVVEQKAKALDEKGLLMKQWSLNDIHAELDRCGWDGSPTKVNRIQNVVLTAQGSKEIEPTDEGITQLVHELIEDHTIG